MSDNLVVSLKASELEILNDIEDIGYGEIHDVSTGNDKPLERTALTSKQINFIRELRSEKGFDILIVHDSEPVSAQKAGLTAYGRGCIKKFRF